ncbi:MAG: MFS transporter [Burkholderiales bacterium]|jgi:MFS family permease|nr:MFS transporter [Burkholderiales bacterium]
MPLVAALRSRDFRVTGTVGLAHGASHFFQLAIPPLFPLLRGDFDVSWTALGFMMTLLFIASGATQFFSGILVDRLGARPVLFGGLFLLAGGTLACALAPNIIVLYALAVLIGVGNGTLHPCDFALMNANIKEHHLGYAYAVHGAGGNIGWALAPVTSYALSAQFGWRGALLVMGIAGLLILALVVSQYRLLNSERAQATASEKEISEPTASWWQWVTVMCFLFFLLQAFAGNGISSFTPSVLHEGFSLSLALSASAVTTYLSASMIGVLIGGVVAARTSRHTRVAASGLVVAALSAVLVFFVAGSSPTLLICFAVMGFSIGITGPSRDMIVRSVTPKGMAGRVYGFVYTGMDVGSMLAPPLLGALLDHGLGKSVYAVIAAALVLAILTVVKVRRLASV